MKNIDETIKFYEQLEFKLTMKVPDEGDVVWAMMTNGAVSFMFQTFESLGDDLPEISREDGGSLLLYIQIKEIRQYHDRIKDKVNILKGLLILFPCFPCDAENTLSEFKIKKISVKNGFSVLAMNLNQHLFLKPTEKQKSPSQHNLRKETFQRR